MVRTTSVAIIGAGIGGLAAAIELAVRGIAVSMFERAAWPGGKIRPVTVGDVTIDGGPTVLTMRWVFDELLAAAGARLEDHLGLEAATVLGRHCWPDGRRLDLYADADRTAAAIGDFAGAAAARGYQDFCAHGRHVYATLRDSFLTAQRPGMLSLTQRAGLGALWRIRPYATLWPVLGEYFRDPRLHQLFGRYAAWCGSSPYRAPASLALIAHVEREGVWLPRGGMAALAQALAALARGLGVRIHHGAEVQEVVVAGGRARGLRLAGGEEVPATAVVVNADVAALGAGRFGAAAARAVRPVRPAARSLSAVTWCLLADTRGAALVRHNVLHAPPPETEFSDLFRYRRLPRQPTVYVCAQDRGGTDGPAPAGPERLLWVVNAPANGDTVGTADDEPGRWQETVFDQVRRCGLDLRPDPALTVRTTPADFAALFPATGGALYGAACHGWHAPFRRSGARTPVPGLYVAGGSAHPGAGVPMAALSGRLAAQALLRDHPPP